MRKFKILKLVKFAFVVLGFGFLVFPSEASATNYYVSTNGSGTDCSIGNPCSAKYGTNIKPMTGGDTLYFNDGLYDDNITDGHYSPQFSFWLTSGGVANDNRLTIKSLNKWGAKIRCNLSGNKSFGVGFGANTGVNYVTLEGFEIYDCKDGVSFPETRNVGWVIKNNKIHDVWQGIGNGSGIVDSNIIYNFGDPSSNQYHGIYTGGHDSTVINNLVYNRIAGNGFYIHMGSYDNPMTGTLLIANNTMYGPAYTSSMIRPYGLLSSLDKIIVANNIGHITSGTTNHLISIGSNTMTSNWNIVNNLMHGFSTSLPCEDRTDQHCSAATISGTVVTDPLFTANGSDFTLRSGSGAINTASAIYAPDHDITGSPRPYGSVDDRGAYEYQASCPSNECYVSHTPAGSENCTEANPCFLKTAHDMADAGDTIYIRGGIYTATTVAGGAYLTWTKSGSAGNVITVKNYPNETPIFTTPLIQSGANTWGVVYAFIRTLESANVKYVTFEGLEIKNFRNHAFDLRWTDNITIKNNNIHDMYVGPAGMISTQIQDDIANRRITNTIIDGNRFTGVGVGCETQSGFHAIYPEYAIGLQIRNNYFEQPVGRYDAYHYQGDIAGPAIKAGNTAGNRDVYIYNNVFEGILNGGSNNWRGAMGWDQRFIWIGGGSPLTNHRHYIYNNTFYSICNNVADSAANCNAIRIGTVYSTMDVQNNIFHKTGSLYQGNHIYKQYSSGIETISHNIYTTSIDNDDSGVGSFVATPTQIALVSALEDNFQLQSTSVAKEVGVDLSAIEFGWDFTRKTPSDPYLASNHFHITTDKNGVTRTAPWSMGAYEYRNLTDVNSDGRVNIKDIQEVIKCIINSNSCSFLERSDINEDEKVNIKDIQEIIRCIIDPQCGNA